MSTVGLMLLKFASSHIMEGSWAGNVAEEWVSQCIQFYTHEKSMFELLTPNFAREDPMYQCTSCLIPLPRLPSPSLPLYSWISIEEQNPAAQSNNS